MKRLLNTLFITTQGSLLARERNTIVVRVGKETRGKFPALALQGVVCFGRVICTHHFMRLCAETSISVSLLSERGRFIARFQGPTTGNVLLRRQQYRWADEASESARIARNMVGAKVAACRHVLSRALRDHPESINSETLHEALQGLSEALVSLRMEGTLDRVRGLEGRAAALYFSVFNELVTQQKEAFEFRGRSRRPPLDRINALLSFLYTLLVHDISSALETVGLDPAVGFLHRDRPGRPSLALDLMEEFRPLLCDRLALSLVNRRQVTAEDFEVRESGAVFLRDEAKKTVIVAYQKRMREEVVHPFLKEKIETGMLFFAQALLLARNIRGDIDDYPPYFVK